MTSPPPLPYYHKHPRHFPPYIEITYTKLFGFQHYVDDVVNPRQERVEKEVTMRLEEGLQREGSRSSRRGDILEGWYRFGNSGYTNSERNLTKFADKNGDISLSGGPSLQIARLIVGIVTAWECVAATSWRLRVGRVHHVNSEAVLRVYDGTDIEIGMTIETALD